TSFHQFTWSDAKLATCVGCRAVVTAQISNGSASGELWRSAVRSACCGAQRKGSRQLTAADRVVSMPAFAGSFCVATSRVWLAVRIRDINSSIEKGLPIYSSAPALKASAFPVSELSADITIIRAGEL